MSKEKVVATFKIGADEIRYEASRDAVEAQMEKVLDRLLDRGITPGRDSVVVEGPVVEASVGSPPATTADAETRDGSSDAELIDQLFHVDLNGHLVLRLVPQAPGDALLFVLYGIRKAQESPWVTAPMLMKTTRAAGVQFERGDRLLAKRPTLYQQTGQSRSKRYRLTTEGETHCRRLARRLLRVPHGNIRQT